MPAYAAEVWRMDYVHNGQPLQLMIDGKQRISVQDAVQQGDYIYDTRSATLYAHQQEENSWFEMKFYDYEHLLPEGKVKRMGVWQKSLPGSARWRVEAEDDSPKTPKPHSVSAI